MLFERLRVKSRKLTILLFDETSLLNPKNLNDLIIFFCVRELFGPLLFGIYIISPYDINPSVPG